MRAMLLTTFWLCAAPALANDGWGGVAATGLTFGQTEAVVMAEEDLFIGLEEIRVDYLFRNVTGQDVTGEVIFPMPPISLAALGSSDWNLPEDLTVENIANFTATVDGKDQPVQVDRIAVIEPAWDEAAPLSQQYDSPGTDVTAVLERVGVPLSLDYYEVATALLALDPAEKAELQAAGLADFMADSDPGIDDVLPLWSVVLRYHWTQTFPAGQEMRIAHRYDNQAPGGLFSWEHPPADWQMAEVEQFCIDDGTSKAMAKAMAVQMEGEAYNMGTAYFVSYVLRTANSWAGPIGKFRLTLDKGAAENVISLCAEGVKKTGPTTFVVEKTDYSPDRDLQILIVKPFAG